MSDLDEFAGDAFTQLEALFVVPFLEILRDLLGLFLGVEGLFREGSLAAFLLMAAALEFGVFFVEPPTVHQHNLGNVSRGAGAVDGSVKAEFDQPWQPSAMIEVRMREDHRVDFVRTDGETLPVARLEVVLLVESAVNQDILAVGLQQVAGAGHIARRAMKTELDVQFAFSCQGMPEKFMVNIVPFSLRV